METVILKPLDFSENDPVIKEAVKLLKNGEIVAIPTETVYGLAVNGYSPSAVKKIYKVKGRPSDNPLILHIDKIDMLYKIANNIPDIALTLANRFWPGPLTMILPKKDIVPRETNGGLNTVAVRMPDNDIALSIIKLCGFPLAAPSANVSGSPSPTSVKHVFSDMNGKIPLIVDGEECECGVESTVVTFNADNMVCVLRPGAVTEVMLSEFAKVIIDDAVLNKPLSNAAPLSPGTMYRHYAPKAEVAIVETDDDEAFNRYVNMKGNDCFALVYNGINPPDCDYLTYGESGSEQAKNLFKKLRELDEIGVNTVYVRAPSKNGIGLAVYNRLIRAADFKIIRL